MNLILKPVLCISRDALREQGIRPNEGCHLYAYDINKTKTEHLHLLHRHLADSKDPAHAYIAEELPQVLPYAVVRCGDEYLTYSRAKGQESRLHGSLSFGFGGHVDLADAYMGRLNLEKALIRELEEELGLRDPDHYTIKPQNLVLIDTTNEVGRVHLGVVYFVDIPSREVLHIDLDEIHLPVWATIDQLKEDANRYENWSKTIINILL